MLRRFATSTRRAPRFDTLCVKHDGVDPSAVKAVALPIVSSSTYFLDSVEHGAKLSEGKTGAYNEKDGYLYSRWGNPTCDVVSKAIARLEGIPDDAGGTALFASGMAAITSAILASIKQVRA